MERYPKSDPELWIGDAVFSIVELAAWKASKRKPNDTIPLSKATFESFRQRALVNRGSCLRLRPSVALLIMSPQPCQVAEYGQVETRIPAFTLNYNSRSSMLTNCDRLFFPNRQQTRV